MLWQLLSLLLFSLIPSTKAAKVITATAFASCTNDENAAIVITDFRAQLDGDAGILNFSIAGLAYEEHQIWIQLAIDAYGQRIYSRYISPCDFELAALCPTRVGSFVRIHM